LEHLVLVIIICFPETGVNQNAAASMALLLHSSCKGSQITASLDFKHLHI